MVGIDMPRAFLLISFVCIGCSTGSPIRDQRGELPPVRSVRGGEIAEIEERIRPHVQQAQRELPGVKERFLSGIHDGGRLFVAVRIHDKRARYEQTYVEVFDWQDRKILGAISNPLQLTRRFREGELVDFDQSQVLDWLIVWPDGTREGHYVGRAL